MTHCDMAMPDAEGVGVSASHDCCLSCIAEAGLLNTQGFQVPPGVPAPSGFASGFQDLVFPTSTREKLDCPLAAEFPPVFLLNGSLLI